MGVDEWFCGVHRQVMLVRRWDTRSDVFNGQDTALMISKRSYCPECWKIWMDETKQRRLDQAIANPRPLRREMS